jgi:(4S)-4-hydroxy-5-phosphonooxypentane-2,3-dione isomerase
MLKSVRVKTTAAILFVSALLLPMATHNAAAQSAPRYVISAVDLEIAPAELEKFIEALKENGAATIKEAGCRQYDISQSAGNPNQVFIYEVYENEAAVQAHRTSEHFKKYSAATKDMVVKRQSRPMVSVARYSKAN